MTLENYDYRTSPFLLRNQFPGEEKLQIPVVPKFQIHNGDFDDLRFIGFDRTNSENSNHRDRMVHLISFFTGRSKRKSTLSFLIYNLTN